jgi:hypothetical protein
VEFPPRLNQDLAEDEMKISATPDFYSAGRGQPLLFLGPAWIEESAPLWDKAIRLKPDYISIDMSGMSFVTLFDWVHVVALVQSLAYLVSPKQIDFDLLGESSLRLMSPASFLRKGGDFKYTEEEAEFSKVKYRLMGFLEALDTYGILNSPHSVTRVIYPGISRGTAALRSFYSAKSEERPKVVLGLQRIKTKEDCRLFLEDSQILNWRRAMDLRFRQSPLFESDEVWRVLCYEFAANIWEHSGVEGCIAARVISSAVDAAGRLRSWCKWTYPHELHPLLRKLRGGFLELCVADAGQGFVSSLKQALLKQETGRKSQISTEEVLAFAFDELGTRKSSSESWATSRHGLCRVLGLVSKYGGALRLRSGDAEVTYVAEDYRFRRRHNSLGYEAQSIRKISHFLRGAQIQLLLPLVPFFERGNMHTRRPTLEVGLPESFRTQPDQVRGHIVPLLEILDKPDACIGNDELVAFKGRCEKLSRQLLTERSRFEPLVFDFSGINWPPGQVETFLHLMENVIQYRPVLLVEISSPQAESIADLERSGVATFIERNSNEIAVEGDKILNELPERRFLETYSSVHSTVLVISRDKGKSGMHIFGLPDAGYEAALLSLLDRSETIEGLCDQFPSIKESVIRAILTPANPLFELRDDGWRLVWSSTDISVESNRAMNKHFDAVALRSKSWRGRADSGDTGRERFYLPWMNAWRKEFLQTSRILNRGRHSDEVAQRLLYRLRLGLSKSGLALQDVKVLICVSAPGMLLASALHRWWPEDTRPAVADLGYYVFVGDSGGLPEITSEGGIVLVQDILDDGEVSRWVIRQLREQDRQVLFILSLVSFIDQASNYSTLRQIESVAADSLVSVERPASCLAPANREDDGFDFLVEPRSLRPVRFRTLRREFASGRDLDLERRNEYLGKFENSSKGCLISSGHFVYGLRHFAVTIDVRRAIESELGDEIAHWIADVCEGTRREQAAWERQEGYQLEGDVTAVLMPLHSQIHYLWPKVENILARRGRRQPIWLLEPSVFTGAGPAYGLPLQFRYQIRRVVEEHASKAKNLSPVRLFVIDDAIATGRTAVTVLSTIIREVRKALGGDVGRLNGSGPVEWIRYFALINETDHSSYSVWRNIANIANPTIRFVLEEYAPFMGVSVYSESNCPICRDRGRLLHLLNVCEDYAAVGPQAWVKDRVEQLRAIAVDGRGYGGRERPRLARKLDVLSGRAEAKGAPRYKASYIDTAIWRFYELMSLSYPPSETLVSLESLWPVEAREENLEVEYERYRWAVYEWCIRHWRRLVADSGVKMFCRSVKKEVELFTRLTERLLEAVAARYEDPDVQELVKYTIDLLASLEAERQKDGRETDESRIERTIQLDTALQLFFFNVQRIDREREVRQQTRQEKGASPKFVVLLGFLDHAAKALDRHGQSFVRNLHRRLVRPVRFADPRWSLVVLAESLFRGRASGQHAGSHQLLPKLLSIVMKGSPSREALRLLHGSLVLFLAALGDLLPYAEVNFSFDVARLKAFAEKIIIWLSLEPEDRRSRGIAPEVRYLFLDLYPEENFCKGFTELFHETPANFVLKLKSYAQRRGGKNLEFSCEILHSASSIPLLTHVQRLDLVVKNRAIDPIAKFGGKHKSLVRFYESACKNFLCLAILTDFASPEETRRLLAESRNARAEEGLLEAFGVRFGEIGAAEEQDRQAGYSTKSEICVVKGFKVKGESV